MNALAKTDDVDAMVNIATATFKKGLTIQSKQSVMVLLEAAQKAQNAEHYATVRDIAAKTLFADELAAVDAAFPATLSTASAEPAAEPVSDSA